VRAFFFKHIYPLVFIHCSLSVSCFSKGRAWHAYIGVLWKRMNMQPYSHSRGGNTCISNVLLCFSLFFFFLVFFIGCLVLFLLFYHSNSHWNKSVMSLKINNCVSCLPWFFIQIIYHPSFVFFYFLLMLFWTRGTNSYWNEKYIILWNVTKDKEIPILKIYTLYKIFWDKNINFL
jgi:hypothetical protein